MVLNSNTQLVVLLPYFRIILFHSQISSVIVFTILAFLNPLFLYIFSKLLKEVPERACTLDDRPLPSHASVLCENEKGRRFQKGDITYKLSLGLV